MGLSWLSYYTGTARTGAARTDAADGRRPHGRDSPRAAALHSRVHGAIELLDALARRAREARRRRAGQRELDRLDDERLRDVGLRRTADGAVVRLR